MRAEILTKLEEINLEEQRILDGATKANRSLYDAFAKEFVINNHRFIEDGRQIVLRKHTRFSDFPAHDHDYVEMTYVCRGKMTHVIKHREVEVLQGDVLLMNRHARHSVRKTTANDLAVTVMISTECFHSLASALPINSPISSFMTGNIRSGGEAEYMLFTTEDILPLENLLENICYTLISSDMTGESTLKSTVGLILAYLSEKPEAIITSARHRSGTELLKARIEGYLATDFQTATLSELAKRLNLSVPYLSKRVSELCGMTFSRLLQEYRFEEAIRLLETTDLPIGDIIVAVGYENTSFFHNQFKERYNCSPFQYRKSLSE